MNRRTLPSLGLAALLLGSPVYSNAQTTQHPTPMYERQALKVVIGSGKPQLENIPQGYEMSHVLQEKETGRWYVLLSPLLPDKQPRLYVGKHDGMEQANIKNFIGDFRTSVPQMTYDLGLGEGKRDLIVRPNRYTRVSQTKNEWDGSYDEPHPEGVVTTSTRKLELRVLDARYPGGLNIPQYSK